MSFAKVRYCVPGRFGVSGLSKILRQTPHDVLLLNGLFDRDFTIPALLLRRYGFAPRKPTIISPRGECSKAALGLKRYRKSSYLKAARLTGLLSDVWVHATSPAEALDIRSRVDFARSYATASNIRAPISALPHRLATDGVLRLLFLGRVSPVKNLQFALRALALTKASVRFSIYGPVEDQSYWKTCTDLIASLPRHVLVEAKGQISSAHIPAALAEADLLFLPSRSENFGHAIYEALACGVPALIGDQTPWQGLAARQAGYDLSLSAPSDFAEVIDRFAVMGEAERMKWRIGASRVAADAMARSEAAEQSRVMLLNALAQTPEEATRR